MQKSEHFFFLNFDQATSSIVPNKTHIFLKENNQIPHIKKPLPQNETGALSKTCTIFSCALQIIRNYFLVYKALPWDIKVLGNRGFTYCTLFDCTLFKVVQILRRLLKVLIHFLSNSIVQNQFKFSRLAIFIKFSYL